MKIIKQKITAKPRVLKERWTCEIQEVEAQHGLDVEEEIMNLMFPKPRHCYE